jgi:hypothetical protein
VIGLTKEQTIIDDNLCWIKVVKPVSDPIQVSMNYLSKDYSIVRKEEMLGKAREWKAYTYNPASWNFSSDIDYPRERNYSVINFAGISMY